MAIESTGIHEQPPFESDEIVSREEAEAVEAAISEAMRGYGLDPASTMDRHVMARMLEAGIVPLPGEGPSVH